MFHTDFQKVKGREKNKWGNNFFLFWGYYCTNSASRSVPIAIRTGYYSVNKNSSKPNLVSESCYFLTRKYESPSTSIW